MMTLPDDDADPPTPRLSHHQQLKEKVKRALECIRANIPLLSEKELQALHALTWNRMCAIIREKIANGTYPALNELEKITASTDRLTAISNYRKRTGQGLLEAKIAVDDYCTNRRT